jgi:EF hand
MKNAILKTVLIGTMGALALSTAGVVSANDQKHGARIYVNAPAPYVNHGYGYGHGGYYGHGHRGYWHGGRWIAPVAIAATVGALAIAANSNYYAPTYYSAPTYYNPPVTYVAPTYYNAPVYASPSSVMATTTYVDQFDAADRNRNGYVSYREAARVNGDWARNFGSIDANRDGFITRDEVNWFYRR